MNQTEPDPEANQIVPPDDPDGQVALATSATTGTTRLVAGVRRIVARPARRVSLLPWWAAILAGIAALLVVVASVLGLVAASTASSTPPARGLTQGAGSGGNARDNGLPHASVHLAAARSTPRPDPPSLANAAPLQPHEIFGYAPYWTLPESSGFDVGALTTLAYFSVNVGPGGTLVESGPGWAGYQSQDLVNLINRAHAAGDRVVLTLTCFNQATLDSLTSNPTDATHLVSELIPVLKAKSLDGVNIDFEGEGSADQAGLTSFVTTVSKALRTTNSHWQISMATYASAAADTGGFYNVAALAPEVDAFFIMAYDMNSETKPSATSPLSGPAFTDADAVNEFLKVVPASKIILGLPFYGYDWPTTGDSLGAAATGPERPMSYAEIVAANHPLYWDPVTQTPWTSYQVGSQWHQTFFDDPVSMALKAQLVNKDHIAGLGIWALGMDGNDPAMLAAFIGGAPPDKNLSLGPAPRTTTSTTGKGKGSHPSGPASTTTTTLVGAGYVNLANWLGNEVVLSPTVLPTGSPTLVGSLTAFVSGDPILACLETGPGLPVYAFASRPGLFYVEARTSPPTGPADCVPGNWSFTVPTSPPTTSTTSTTTPASGASGSTGSGNSGTG